MKIAKDGSQNFIAILKEKYNGWYKLLQSNRIILKFKGEYYD